MIFFFIPHPSSSACHITLRRDEVPRLCCCTCWVKVALSPKWNERTNHQEKKKNRERERGTDETIIWAVLPLFTPVVSPTLHISGTSPARAAWLQVHRGRVLRQDQRRVSVPAGPVPQVKTAAGLFTYCQQHRLPGKNRKRKQLLLCSIFMMFWMLRIYLFWMLLVYVYQTRPKHDFYFSLLLFKAWKWSTINWPMRRQRCSVTTSW